MALSVRFLMGVAAACVALSASSDGRADAIPMHPQDCPAGSRGVSSHSGAYCMPTTCETDADCKDDDAKVCAPQALCVATEEYTYGGRMRPNPDAARPTRRVAKGACAAKAACADPATCETVKRCVAKAAAAPPTPTDDGRPVTTTPADASPVGITDVPPVDKKRSSCGCVVTTPQEAGGLFALGLAVAGAMLVGRRRR